MASPCASAPWSLRYAIASAVTAGWRGKNASTSRCARSLDHDAIAFQVSTSVGRSVMTAHALVAARRITRQRRRAEREDVPPAVARRRLAEDVRAFVTLDAFVRRARPGGELVDEREACRACLAQPRRSGRTPRRRTRRYPASRTRWRSAAARYVAVSAQRVSLRAPPSGSPHV